MSTIARLEAGTTARFNYMFADDPDTTMPELLARHGQSVTIIRDATPEEHEAEGDPQGYIVKFGDGTETLAWFSEIEELL